MLEFIKAITLADLVDVVGVAGFVLSLVLAIHQILANRLKIEAGPITLIHADKVPGSVFFYVCLSNKTRLPFSLLEVYLNLGNGHWHVPIETTVRTFRQKQTKDKLEVKPVVLSQKFPARFDSYASEVFLLEVLRQNIGTTMCSLNPPEVQNQEGRLRKLSRRIRRLCTRPLPPQIVLNTSRGRRALSLCVSAVEDWEWLEKYAVQKAGYEEKIVFPQ